jgi:hypothetical protein
MPWVDNEKRDRRLGNELGAARRVMKREHMLSMVMGVLSVLALSSLVFAAKDRFELKAPQAVAGLVR